MKLKFKVTVKLGPKTLAEFEGLEKDTDDITMADMQNVIQTEQFFEKLTGLRVHIEQVL